MIDIVYTPILFIGVPVLLGIAYWRWAYYKQPLYRYSSLLPLTKLVRAGRLHTLIPYLLRCIVLGLLIGGLARLRTPDVRSKVPVEGVDIILVLDASGSMQLIDDRADERDRFTIARNEAIEFIKKRENDPMGLVIFAGVAVTRCPLTLDKVMLEGILRQTSIETIPVGGTVLADAIVIAANRLKKSKAASRIMIVLTDGAPSPHDSNPAYATELAKKLGIKIYTVGIGSEGGGWYFDRMFGWIQQPTQYNERLLQRIAEQTGGQFFKASKPLEMAQIYETIDTLEKSEHEMPVYARYYEYFIYFLWAALALLLLELILTTLIWVRL